MYHVFEKTLAEEKKEEGGGRVEKQAWNGGMTWTSDDSSRKEAEWIRAGVFLEAC